jgi:GxxExxY protein
MFDNDLTRKVIGCAIEVHRHLGPGLLESAYHQCLAHELTLNQIPFKIELPIPIVYKGLNLDCGYRLDLLIDDKIILELKSVTQVLPIHEAQLLTYMKLSKINLGLLINFNQKILKDGIHRFVL